MSAHGGSLLRFRRALVGAAIAAGFLLPGLGVGAQTPDDSGAATSTAADDATAPTDAVASTTPATSPTTSSSTTSTTSTTTSSTTTTTAPPTTAPPTTTRRAPAPVVTPVPTPLATPPTAAPRILAATAPSCTISREVSYSSRGAEARCAEQVLASLGLRFVGPDDHFGISTVNALKAWQRSNGLAPDGVVGQVTGTRLGIWVRSSAPAPPPPTPPAPPPDALPANSGTGRRVVYSRSQQRVWAVEANGAVVKTHLVSGRLHEPYAGTYHVYSRSMYTFSTANPDVKWRYMVRFAYGPNGGRIGFHEIPNRFGVPLQSEAQLGQPLSGGCVRQSTPNAQWMWNWAGIGTKVVVL